MGRIRILVADDDPLMREALGAMVRSEPGFELVGLAADADDAIEQGSLHHPEVVLMDVKMPGGGGPRATRSLLANSPKTRIVALSAYEDRATVVEMVRAGATGYLVKGASVERIMDAIRQAMAGQGTLSTEVTAILLNELASKLGEEAEEEDTRRRQRQRVENAFRPAALRPVYQPIVDLHTGMVAGFEALARFRCDPVRSPDRWFADADAVGRLAELELAAIEIEVEESVGLPPSRHLSVNASPSTALLPDLWDILGRAGRPLVVEITEHAPVDDYEALAAAMAPFRNGGGRLSVDDAGAGFASLRHILRLDPDFIKLDITLTSGIHADRRKRALASAIISFAGEIGAAVIAEGIEAAEEVGTLLRLGVGLGQGYFLGCPGGLPAPGHVEPVWLGQDELWRRPALEFGVMAEPGVSRP